MSKKKRPLPIDTILLLSDSDDDNDSDDDDLLLLQDTTTFSLRQKSPAIVTPTTNQQETCCLTLLGTCTFPLVVANDKCIGQQVQWTLEEEKQNNNNNKGNNKIIMRLQSSQGDTLSSFLPEHVVQKIAPILLLRQNHNNNTSTTTSTTSSTTTNSSDSSSNTKYHCRATRTCRQFLQFTFFAKAHCLLGTLECAPWVQELTTYLGETTALVRPTTKTQPSRHRATQQVANSNANVNGTVVKDSTLPVAAAAAVLPLVTPTNRKENDKKNPPCQQPSCPDARRALAIVGQAYTALSSSLSLSSDPRPTGTVDDNHTRRVGQPTTTTTTTMPCGDLDTKELHRSFFPHNDNVSDDNDHVDTMPVEMSEPDWENQKDDLERMFDQQLAEQCAHLPAHDMPRQLSSSQHLKLFEYQITGIRWLIHAERRTDIPAWFTADNNEPGTWRDKITGSTWYSRPSPVRGGILADDMGLGKTVQILGLILSNPPQGQTGYPYVPIRSLGTKTSRCTLIVCPLSVIANWKVQIRKHVNNMGRKEILKVGVYHGPNRNNLVRLIQSNYYDVVLTSYQTLAYDYRRYVGADEKEIRCKLKAKRDQKHANELFLFDVWLHRIVLDEAHIIRNSKSWLFAAVKQLKATNKICLTGTVFVNKPDDIHSLLSFLEALPLAQKHVFQKYVTDKIRERKEVGMAVLRAAMAYVTLRRRKDMVAGCVKLVKRTVKIEAIPFDDGPHKALHDVLYMSARALLDHFFMLGDDVVVQNYMHFIALILRVRQASCHASLVPAECKEKAEQILATIQEKGTREMDIEEAEELLVKLQGAFEGGEIFGKCAVCLEALDTEGAVILRDCKHIFCAPCLNQVTNSSCPLCRASFNPDDMISKGAAQKAASRSCKKPKVNRDECGQSPKLKQLFALMDRMKPDEKGVIFSQWTSLLDIVQQEMKDLGHTFTRIDGSMNPEQRILAMERFDTERCDSMRTPRFILCSLHACGTGINLERGNVAFMLDPWFNAAAETQAMNRIHRISSTKPVRVYRLVMNDTLEQRMLGLQDAKELLGKGAHERLSQAEKRKARLTHLRDLFELPEDIEKDWDAY